MANFWNPSPAPGNVSEQLFLDQEMAAYMTPESINLSDFGTDSPCVDPAELFASAGDSYLTSPFLSHSHDSGIDLNLYASAGASPDLFAASDPFTAAINEAKGGASPSVSDNRRHSTQSSAAARKRRVGRNTAVAPADVEDKKAWQKHKNTLAARKSRNRKRHEVDQLTETVRQLREALASKGYSGPLMTDLVEIAPAEAEDEDEDE